ncbi:MAG TPA: ribosome recycling factor [Chthoniobacterales bacterium]
MNGDDILLETEESMEKNVEYMLHEFSSLRTGKASPGLVDNLDVAAYGTTMKLKQLALISTPEPRLLLIQPFDASVTRDIEKAINESRLGINPSVDGKLIRLPIPELSEERRRDLVKAARHMAEETRVRVRSSRRAGIDQIKKLEKDGQVTEDDRRSLEEEVQKLTDKYVKQIDAQLEHKEVDIMKV